MKTNKKILTLAVLSTISLPYSASVLTTSALAAGPSGDGSGPEIYGRFRLGVQRDDFGQDKNNWGLENQSSRFGIRGKEVINDELAVPYQYEFQTNPVEDREGADTLGRRKAWVGLEGELGRVSLGRQISAYYYLVGTIYNLGQEGFDVNHLQFDTTSLSDKISDTIQYQMSYGNLSFGGDVIMDQDDSLGGATFTGDNRVTDFDDIDGFTVGANYETDKWRLAGGYQESQAYGLNEDGSINKQDGDVWSIWAHYNLWKKSFIFFSFEDGSLDSDNLGSDTVDGQAYHTGINMRFGDWQLWSIFDFMDLDEKSSGDGGIFSQSADREHYSFGAAYFLSARTRFYAEFGFVERDLGSDTDVQVLGIRHDF